MTLSLSLLLLAAAFVLILANGFFVAAEFGLVTVERPDAERAAARGDRGARAVTAALRELSFQLSGTQLGITLTSLVVGMLAEPALARLLSTPLRALGLPPDAVSGVSAVLGMLIASAAQMVVGELVPKNWAISRPLAVARRVARPQRLFSAAFRPVIALLNTVANRLVGLLGVQPADELASARTPGELVSLARHSARAGAIEQDTADLFVRTLSLGELTAQHVMTPRVRVSALQAEATAEDVINLTRATGLSRFPVYADRLDEVTGMAHLKDALAVPAAERLRTTVARIAVAPLMVPQTLPVQPLLERLRGGQPIAVVVDEYGGTAGVVTLEDIVEELVGEVRDEHDRVGPPDLAPAAPEPDGRPAWEADGGCRVDVLRRVGLRAPDGPYETVAGLVAGLLGRIPAPGDIAYLPEPHGHGIPAPSEPPDTPAGPAAPGAPPGAGSSGWQLRVRLVAHHRAERVRLVPAPARPAAAAAHAERPAPEGRDPR
jgi:CBS domain containing-hemolysin-like protein